MKAEILIGIPASGKTTYAEKKCAADRSWVNVNRDDIRFSITGAEGWKNYKFTKAVEDMVTQIQFAIVAQAKAHGKNVIISDTNLNPSTRAMWHKVLKAGGYEVTEVPFPITLEEAYLRDTIRPNGATREVIYEMYQKWLKYIGRKTYTPDLLLPKAIIFDIDGTLAIMGDRSPYDWHKVGIDKPNQLVIEMLLGYRNWGYRIIIVSGRDAVCMQETKDWLHAHGAVYDLLSMRAVDDQRKDTIVKEEIFWRDIAHSYNVAAVVDDRPCVCRMWRELGLSVFQVADPYKEF